MKLSVELGHDEVEYLTVNNDMHLREFQRAFPSITIGVSNNKLSLSGPALVVKKAIGIIEARRAAAKGGRAFSNSHWMQCLRLGLPDASKFSLSSVRVQTRTTGQSTYLKSLLDKTVNICVGPAGTGKTFLAVAAALDRLLGNSVKRIVLVRPIVEAGEKLGFLPGDFKDKVNPYMRPLLDSLQDLSEAKKLKDMLSNDTIEIAPLAYMRGRTLNDAYIILDEAQNATLAQLKMLLTRLGHGSQIAIVGDMTQIDLPRVTDSGLNEVLDKLSKVADIGVHRLGNGDIVRHPLIDQMLKALT